MLTHIDKSGQANMVDVTEKALTERSAFAEGYITMNEATLNAVANNTTAKGDVLATARIAGIQGAKKCAELIPLCHPLLLTKIDVKFNLDSSTQRIIVLGHCKVNGNTGVEMEALTAVNIALLTLFDMCKAMDPNMIIGDIKVLEKIGGKSGHWQHENYIKD